jgi:hypothetical protein
MNQTPHDPYKPETWPFWTGFSTVYAIMIVATLLAIAGIWLL